MVTSDNLTRLIHQLKDGDIEALDAIFRASYQNLYAIARNEKRKVWGADTINTTALVNEVFIKLSNNANVSAENRAHFYAISARAMRQILLKHYEAKTALKRGGDWHRVSLAQSSEPSSNPDELLMIHQSLEKLQTYAPDLANLVEMRFFGGMTEQDIGSALQCDERTVRRKWKKAKMLLQSILMEENTKAII